VVNPARSDPRLPKIGEVFGNPEYNKRFRAALQSGRKVVLDPKVSPTLVTATDPQSIVNYLMRNLSLVTVLSDAQEQVNQAKRTHADPKDLQKIVTDAESACAPYMIDPDYPGLMRHLEDSIGE
jgi:hypothetical protein